MNYRGQRSLVRLIATSFSAFALAAVSLINPIGAPHANAADGDPVANFVDIAKWNDGLLPDVRYRIPAFTQAPNGDLLAFFDLRPGMADLPSNVGVVLRRSTDAGKTWGPIQTVHFDEGKKGEGDPSVLVDRDTGRIFVFYVGTVNSGFGGGAASNDPDNPNTQQVDYSYSDDNGLTWHQKRITAEVKDSTWAGIFASSGEGIQVRHGKYAGRLVQQYAIRVNGANKNVSMYSDNHGETWKFGTPLDAISGDENKVVELSDGRLMMSLRTSPYRRVAYSSDGGQTWGQITADGQQIDPASNGTIVRVYPDAPASDPKSKMLMLLNAEDPGIRKNVTAKVSCDDGAHWQGRYVIDANESEYVTGTPIFDKSGKATGKVGVLVERDGYATISYTSVDTTKMDLACVAISAKNSGQETRSDNRNKFTAGSKANYGVDITNLSGDTLPAGTFTIEGTDGAWTQKYTANVSEISAGATQRVTVSMDLPTNVLGDRMLLGTYTSGTKTAKQYFFITLNAPAQAPQANPKMKLEVALDAVYSNSDSFAGVPKGASGIEGDWAVPWIRVTNTGNVTPTNVTVTDGNGSNVASYCKWSSGMAPGVSNYCKDRAKNAHTITAAEAKAGKWTPTYTLSYTYGGTTYTEKVTLDVDLAGGDVLDLSNGSHVYLPTGDFQSSSFYRVPDTKPTASWLIPHGYPLALTMASNNRTSAQLTVRSDKAGKLEAKVSDGAVKWDVQYVSDIITEQTGTDTKTGSTTDPLRKDAPTVEVGKNQSIWFTANVPAGTKAGSYNQTISLTLDGTTIGEYPVTTKVYDVELRDTAERPFILDMWYHPDTIAREYGLEVWSDEHIEAMAPYLKALADAGQDVVNIVISDDPWYLPNTKHAQTDEKFNSSVLWTWNGHEYEFDFTAFDKVVDAHTEAGIVGPIHAFGMLNFRNHQRLYYLDETTGKMVEKVVTLGSEEYNQAWGQFLRAFTQHLKEKGWFDRTSLGFDEQELSIMNQMKDTVAAEAPEWNDKIALAANSTAEADVADYIAFNYSFLYDKAMTQQFIDGRVNDGRDALFYTFYDPLKPNIVTATPPISSRMLGWIVEKKNLDGYLHWTFNSWPKNVFENPSFMYGQGDEYAVYPGAKAGDDPISSIRWESLKDGIDDAEILNLAKNAHGVTQAQMAALYGTEKNDTNALVWDQEADTVQSWSSMVRARQIALELASGKKQQADTTKVKAETDGTRVTPLDPVTITVSVTAPAERELDLPIIVKPDQVPAGWKVTPAQKEAIYSIPAGMTKKFSFDVVNTTGLGSADFSFTVDGVKSNTVSLTGTRSTCTSAKVLEYSADSEESAEGNGSGLIAAAFDGNINTYWHTNWNTNPTGMPHWVKMKADATELCSLIYKPRDGSGSNNGRVRDYEVYISTTGTGNPIDNASEWTSVAKGQFPNTGASQTVQIPETLNGSAVTGSYVAFVVRSNQLHTDTKNNKWASAAELQLNKRQPLKFTPNAPTITNPSAGTDGQCGAAPVVHLPYSAGFDYEIAYTDLNGKDQKVIFNRKQAEDWTFPGDIRAVKITAKLWDGFDAAKGATTSWTFNEAITPCEELVDPTVPTESIPAKEAGVKPTSQKPTWKNEADGSAPAAPEIKDGGKIPATGANILWGVCGSLLLIAGGVVLAVRRRPI